MTATFWEYQIPTPMPMAHSMSVDPVRRIAWWGEESHLANKIGRFNMDTETFQEYPVPTRMLPFTRALWWVTADTL